MSFLIILLHLLQKWSSLILYSIHNRNRQMTCAVEKNWCRDECNWFPFTSPCSYTILLFSYCNLLLHRHYIQTRTKAKPLMFYLISYFLWVKKTSSFTLLGSYIPDGLMTSCTLDYMTYTLANRCYTMMLCCFVFFIPLGIIFYCYLFMFLAIRKTGRYCNSYIREYVCVK